MLKLGIISELGTGENLGYCRVDFDEVGMVSGWLPVPSLATKDTKHWHPTEVGSQVACLMDEECEQGVVVAALWSDTDTPPDWANDKTIGIQFADGAKLYYDFNAHKAIFDAPDSSLQAKIKDADIEAKNNIKLKCNTLEVSGDIDVKGKIDATGDIKAGTVSLQNHTHPANLTVTGSSDPITNAVTGTAIGTTQTPN